MLKNFIHKILQRRHFWRDIGFDELSEIYISMMFRGFSISLTGLFVPLYLLRLGYDITGVLIVPAAYFMTRALVADVLSAHLTARYGPKHTILIGNLVLIVSTIMFLTQVMISWPLWLLGLVWGASASLFFIPFHVSFSKIKHSEHGGKELGYVNIMEKLGFVVGPLVGGVIATMFGAQYIFLVGALLLVMSTITLFRTAEPVAAGQRLDWRGIDVAKHRRDFVSYGALGVENNISIYIWPLYLGMFVLLGSAAYAKLGILSSISVIVSVVSALLIGKLIDKRRGRPLLRVSAVLNALLHLTRPLVKSYGVAIGVNIANESVTAGYRMPYFKGVYDAADDLPGYRIVYIASLELFSSLLKGVMYIMLVLLSTVISGYQVLVIVFIVGALASLVIMTERYKALSR